jgi:hypothetical protein
MFSLLSLILSHTLVKQTVWRGIELMARFFEYDEF